MIRVLLVDDHPLVVEGLVRLLEGAEGVEVVGSCVSGTEALRAMAASHPDVMVLDMRLGDMSSLEICRRAASVAPLSRIVLLTAYDDVRAIRQCLDLGAAGVFLKSASPDDLLDALQSVAAGETVIDPMLRGRLFAVDPDRTENHCGATQLRPRETQVLRLIATGASTEAIADELGLTVNTVRTYVQTTMGKMGVSSRIQAVVMAQRDGLL